MLSRDVCSYGYFLLAPNRWRVPSQSLERVLDLPGGPARVTISQPALDASAGRTFPHRPGARLTATTDRSLAREDRAAAREQIARMLRLEEDASHAAAFHGVDPRWRATGRCRLFRSPTLFEDIVKTVTSCNVTWPGTVGMNSRLCEVLGRAGAFPTAKRLARTRPATLRARCRVGYRDARLVELARLFADSRSGVEASLTDPSRPDEEVFKSLKELPGIGPYAAGNIMMLLGRYSRLALDSESLRHARHVLGMRGKDASLLRRLAEHYAAFGPFRFKSYWFEMWDFYESKRGVSHNWDRDEVGSSFTAAKL